ncbi:hypothetical protein MCHLDSM_00649 [Mycolicibacterium chlorophenolicum]|uniref:Uncharacterized protein n=1 Tax=Mycolicibacterium chlorophenolicum TaxID=37916 RepID=A0A0J6WJJ4_9MYCO|nr:hypothetical protein MCHLDSM_00649 [Mycolicibacterium chlorophenolicum]
MKAAPSHTRYSARPPTVGYQPVHRTQARTVAKGVGVAAGFAASTWMMTSLATGVASADDGESSSSASRSTTSQSVSGATARSADDTKGPSRVAKAREARQQSTSEAVRPRGSREDRQALRSAKDSAASEAVSGVKNDATTSRATTVRRSLALAPKRESKTVETPPVGQHPKPLAGVVTFLQRNVFNAAPVVTDVQINRQGVNGTITGDIDARDPDELGQRVQIRSTVRAGAPTPAPCGCEEVPGLIGFGYTNPAVIGGGVGDNWNAPAAVDSTTVYLNPDYSLAYYAGKETGTVTIDGLGAGDVVLDFVGNLSADGASEKSVATLNSDLGTGDLKGVEGTVISESALNADGTALGVLTGEVVRPEVRYIVVRKPRNGTVTIDEITGTFSYRADPAFLAAGGGADTFTVLVTDNRFSLANLFKRYNGDPVQTVMLTVV